MFKEYAYLAQHLYLGNEILVPPGATFWIRTVRLKGSKGGRLDLAKCQNHKSLKKEYNLLD